MTRAGEKGRGPPTTVILFQVSVFRLWTAVLPRVALLLNVTYRFPYRRVTKNEPPPRAVLKILRDGPGIRITKRCYSLWVGPSPLVVRERWPGRFFSGGGRGKFYAIKGSRYGTLGIFERGQRASASDKSSFIAFIARRFCFGQIYKFFGKRKRMDFNEMKIYDCISMVCKIGKVTQLIRFSYNTYSYLLPFCLSKTNDKLVEVISKLLNFAHHWNWKNGRIVEEIYVSYRE